MRLMSTFRGRFFSPGVRGPRGHNTPRPLERSPLEDRTDKEVARARLPTTHAQECGDLGPMANLVRHGLHNQLPRRHRTSVLSDLYLLRNDPPLCWEGS